MLAFRCAVACVFASSFIAPALAQNGADVCLAALKTAAHDEYSVNEKTDWEQHFHHAFCDALHKKQQNNSSQSGDLLTDAIFLHLQSDQSSLAEYDHTYCASTAIDTSYALQYSFWSKVVHGDALSKFNECMRIVTPSSGLITSSQNLDTCHFAAKIKYVPSGSNNQRFARVKRDATLLNASCGSIPYKGQKITAAEIPVSCTRFGRTGSFVILDTDQGDAVISAPDLPLPAMPGPPPDAPKWDSADPITGQPYKAVFSIQKGLIGAGKYPNVSCIGAGWTNCQGSFSLPAGALIPNEANILYQCGSGSNEDGHAYCGWSYNRDPHKGYAGDVVVTGNSFTWYRRYNTDKDMLETYTVSFLMPHQKTRVELQYERDIATYRKEVMTNPCPWIPGPKSSSWLSSLFSSSK